MLGPGLAQVFGNGYGTAAATVIAHVEHEHAGFNFCYLCFGGIGACQVMQMPGFATVFAVHHACIRYACRIDELDGENQRAVLHGDAASRALQQEVPGRVFHLRSDVDRFAPCLSVVFALDKHQLGRFIGSHARHGVPPGASVTHSVSPGCNNPDGVCFFVYQDGRVAYAVLCMRQTAGFAEGHGYAHRFPGLSFVCTAAHAYVDHFLQIDTAVVTDIVNAKKRAVVGRNQSRDTEGCRAVIACLAYTDTYAAGCFCFPFPFDGCGFVIDGGLRHREGYSRQ